MRKVFASLAMATVFSVSVASAQNAGLVAAYSFDEATGTTAADKSGLGNNGTLVNGTTWSTTSKFGAAAGFDGTNDRIDVADSNSLDLASGMTLEAWVRPTANSSYRTVMLKEVTGELAYSLYAADSDHGARSSGWIRSGNVSHYADGTSSLPLNSYSHIAVTYNGTALVFYVNGVATRTTAVSGSIQTSSMPLRIGGNTVWGEYFQGQIDEVRVYNRALSQSEIQIDMVTPIGGSSGGTADTTAPTVSLTAPSDGATISGTATLSANAGDNVGVVGVQFKVDGANVGAEDTTSPYSIQWNTTGTGNGSHQITAVARDAAGNITTSSPQTVAVSNTTGDSQAPTVSLTSPASGATVSGTLTVTASASDNVGVIGVQFKLDGANLGTEDTSSPYSRSWDSATASNGTHSLTAVARDAAGNTTTSTARTVTVSNSAGDSQAPTVSMTAPASGARISGSVSVTASASDNVGVVGVQFKLDGVNLGTEDTSSPYSRTWDSSTAGAGTHSLTAVARDAAGNTTTSAGVNVTVDNGDTVDPAVSFTSPASGATVSGSVTVAANASDNVGVVGVQFRLDGNSLGAEDLASPYSVSWTTTGTSNGTHQLTAIARDASGRTATATRSVTVSNGGGGGTSLTIDGNQRFQTIDGFGVSANSASWNGGELRPAIDRLVEEGGSTIWRVVMEMADWEASNDDASPSTFNWTYYNTIYSSPKFEELWGTLAYLNQKGITTQLMLNFMGRGPTWMGGADMPTAMEDEWVETVASVAYYARNNRHIQFGLFAPNNESDWDGIEGIRMDAWQNARVMRKLAAKLDAIGLGDLRLVGPDTAAIATGVGQYMPALMGEPAVMAKMDHFAFHNYAGDSGGAANAIRNSAYPSRNFWISEVSNIWDALAHMSQGPSAILVWDGYDSVYNHAILAGRGSSPPNDVGNGPALLSYSTSTRLYTPRKPFYEFAQLFKFVPAGSVRVAAVESSSNITIYAFLQPVTGRVTLVGRNAGSSNVTFSGVLSNLPVVPSFESYVTNTSVNLQRGTDVPVSNGAFTFVAAGNSVFTLTYAGAADSIPPTVSVTSPTASATVSGAVTVSSATAADNVGIQGVQFKLDGTLLGVEDTAAPYGVQWNTANIANGTHSLTAVARDGRGNVTTSEPIAVTVSN